MPCAHCNVHLGRIGDRRVTHPERYFLEIEAPDATDLKGRNLVRFDELIDRTLLDSQQIRQFLDGQDVLFPIHYASPYSPHVFKRAGFKIANVLNSARSPCPSGRSDHLLQSGPDQTEPNSTPRSVLRTHRPPLRHQNGARILRMADSARYARRGSARAEDPNERTVIRGWGGGIINWVAYDVLRHSRCHGPVHRDDR